MEISEDRLHEFIHLYEAEFGESLSLNEAAVMTQRIMLLLEAILRPLPHELPRPPSAPKARTAPEGV